MCYEQKEVGHGVVDKYQELMLSNGHRAIQVSDGSLVLQSLPQGSVVCWDRFLPIRSLKVLLVKNDDSTRHVVSALLRNSSYEVNDVANGLQAWKILEDSNNHIDLVLMEVVMPILSGIGLLCKLMRHKSLKNIPAIMKPIRKNELQNLWKHVWRRCHSQDNGSTGLSIWDGSDNGSGTQNSRAAKVHSPRSMPYGDQLTDAPDSTCAQVIHTKPQKCSNRWVHSIETKEFQEPYEKLDNAAIGKDLEIRGTRNQDLQCEHQQKKFPFALSSQRNYKLPEIDSQPFEGKLDHNGENISSSAKFKQNFDSLNGVYDMSQVKGNCDSGEHPSIELTLKRLRGAGDVGKAAHDDCNVLRHSDLLAFSNDILFFPLLCKYNTPSSANKIDSNTDGLVDFSEFVVVALHVHQLEEHDSDKWQQPLVHETCLAHQQPPGLWNPRKMMSNCEDFCIKMRCILCGFSSLRWCMIKQH
ncbi:hypothetical protein UlMin_012325 [Ulmus minor]